MRFFDNTLEALIIKYTLGTMFITVTLVFGIKILILLSTVAKLKLIGILTSLKDTPWEFIFDGAKTIWERGSVK